MFLCPILICTIARWVPGIFWPRFFNSPLGQAITRRDVLISRPADWDRSVALQRKVSTSPHTSIVRILKVAIRLLRTGKYSDLTIKCKSKVSNAHRSIVCLQSEPLAKMVDGTVKPGYIGFRYIGILVIPVWNALTWNFLQPISESWLYRISASFPDNLYGADI